MKNFLITAITLLTSLCPAFAESGGELTAYDVTYTSGNSQNMATITVNNSNGKYKTLSEAVKAVNEYTTYTVKRVNIVGEISSTEASALANIKSSTLDLSKATGLTAESFTNANVKYVVLPDAWDKTAVNAFGKNTDNTLLESTAAADYIYVTKTLRHYYDNETEITDTTKVYQDGENYYYDKTLSKEVNITLVEGYPINTYSYVHETQTYTIDEKDVTNNGDNYTIFSLKIPLLPLTEYYKQDGTTLLQDWQIHSKEDGKYYYWEDNTEKETKVTIKYYYLKNWGNDKVFPEKKEENEDGTYYTTILFDSPATVSKKTEYKYSYLNYEGSETLYLEQETEYQGSTYTVTKQQKTQLTYIYKEETKNAGIRLTAYVRKPKTLVYTIMNMSHFNSSWNDSNNTWYSNDDSKYTYSCTDLKEVIISGKIYAIDINSQIECIDANGNYVSSGGKKYNTLDNNTAYYFDFSEAEFGNGTEEYPYHPEDMTMSGFFYTPCGNIENIILPTAASQTTIPENFINGSTKIESICIPYNYQYIEANAFYNASALKHIYTTDPENTKENPDKVKVDHGVGTFTFSANLKHIKSKKDPNGYNYTFFGDAMQQYVSDIYVNATVAPKCDAYSFQGDLTYGNNGFAGNWTHPISRNNYVNSKHVICILHYPTLSKTTRNSKDTGYEDENYTDVTRKYTLADETGVVDGYGITKSWPRHAEFFRSYNQAVAGHIWYDWQEYEEGNSEVIQKLDKKYVVASPKGYNHYDYQGWHEFVLAENHITKEFKPQTFYDKFDQKDWYTICVPYDVPRSILLKAFGVSRKESDKNSVKMIDSKEYTKASEVTTEEGFSDNEWIYPDVRSLIQVKRSYNSANVTLCLSEPLITATKCQEVTIPESKQGYKYTTLTGEDPVIIKAGMPYLIRPFIPNDEKISNFGAYIVAYATQNGMSPVRRKVFDNEDITYTVPQEKGVESQALNYDKTTDGKPVYVDDCKYYFVGTYVDTYVPRYGYYLGKSKNTGKHTFFRAANANKTKWNHYSAIIKGMSEPKYNQGGTGQTNITNISIVFNNIVDDLITLDNEKPSPEAASKMLSFSLDDSGLSDDFTTSAEEIEVEFLLPEQGDGIIRTLGGVPVNSSNLQKGIYIRNGKKFVVK